MHFPTDWSDRLIIEDGHIVRVVKAYYDGKRDCYSEIEVYKERDDGMSCCRNLYCSMWGGYTVAFPGQPINKNYNSWYYDTDIAEEGEWGDYSDVKRNVGYSDIPHTSDYILIEQLYPDFKYVVKKYFFNSLADVMEKLQMWILHPEIELMLAAGFERLSMNKNLYRMTKQHQKEVMQFCRKYSSAKDLSLREIRWCMKNNTEDTELLIKYLSLVPDYDRLGWTRETSHYYGLIDFDGFKYLHRKGIDNENGVWLLKDYRHMLNNSNHDPMNKYWRYPKDLQKRHDKLLEERRIAEQVRERMRLEKRAKELQKKTSNFQKVCKKYAKYNAYVDGYYIYISDTLEDWERQAKELHQCIVRCDYMNQVANRQCLLFFIRKDDVPVATCQVFPNKKIGQFYADEIDRNNCRPSQEVQDIFNRFLEKVVIKEAI